MDKDTKWLLTFCGIGSVIGAITGLGLVYFTALSPFVIGGIVGSIFPTLIAAYLVGGLLYDFCKRNKIEKDDKKATVGFSIAAFVSAAVGVGLAAAASAIFPGVTLGMGSAALACAVIGAIAPVVGLFIAILTVEYVIIPIADKVNKHIISPIVEKVNECFSLNGTTA